jgi:large subunit ribosomal protein L3
MKPGLLGRKIGMTQIYQDDGKVIPVTVLECGPCTVLQLKTEENDGYSAIQLGFSDKRRKSATAADRGHAKKAETEPKKFVREIRQSDKTVVENIAIGSVLTVDLFQDIKSVDVIGTSKGRGFAGVIKRHGFKGLRATHGVKRMHRHPGSSGPSADPSRTFPGVKKPGHYGVARVTSKNLKVVKIDTESNLLLVKGAVPGPNGGFIVVRQSLKA